MRILKNANRTPLKLRQLLFAREYLTDFNSTQAAIRAGYSRASAHVTGSRLLSQANVTEEIHRQFAQRVHRSGNRTKVDTIGSESPDNFPRNRWTTCPGIRRSE